MALPIWAVLAEESIPGRFIHVARDAKAVAVDVKLGKVDSYNQTAVRLGRPQISYQAYSLSLPDDKDALDFRFFSLSEEQFLAVKGLYGGHSRVRPKRGRHDYNFVDFMPPLVQALNGHNFKIAETRVNGLRGDSSRSVDDSVRTSMNCFSTAYALLQQESFSNPRVTPLKFNVFFTGRFQAYDYFMNAGQKIPFNQLQMGDVILLVTERQLLHSDRKIELLEHVMTYIDDGLVFEKTNGGDRDPFRFQTLKKAIDPYTSRLNVSLYLRRFRGALPEPDKVFGGSAYAIDEAYAKPLPHHLREKIFMHKEILFPEDTYQNSWSQSVDVHLDFDSLSGRFRLNDEAYRESTFDVNRNVQRTCAEELQTAK
ncbi:MAG: hypothetical protein KF799_07150 [Bdellovibrionales bacterium]|nr:hypothetical protein [Bdellovibrionales bacterium]